MEFAVLAGGAAETASRLAAQLERKVAEFENPDARNCPISIHIGSGRWRTGTCSIEHLIAQVDESMLRKKQRRLQKSEKRGL